MLAVCAAGRILNPKSARSQVIGAMTMGAGAALMEELAVDTRTGFFVSHDLAGYEVPVHADIPHQEVIFLDETDPISSPMKAKGVAELGICGVAAAIANAIYNASGCACATIRSRWTSCSTARPTSDEPRAGQTGASTNHHPLSRVLWDSHAHDAIIEKTIRGLYYHHFKEILGGKAKIRAYWFRSLTTELISMTEAWRGNSVGSGEFIYRFGRGEQSPLDSVWVLEFYGAH